MKLNNFVSQCDPVDKPADVEHCEKNDNNKPAAGESEIKSVPSATEEKNGKILLIYLIVQ